MYRTCVDCHCLSHWAGALIVGAGVGTFVRTLVQRGAREPRGRAVLRAARRGGAAWRREWRREWRRVNTCGECDHKTGVRRGSGRGRGVSRSYIEN